MEIKQACIECGEIVEDYEPEFCCNGWECGCRGLPIEPPVCFECERKYHESDTLK